MANPRAALLTVDDLLALPDEDLTRYELIDGVLHVSRAAGNPHQSVIMQIAIHLGTWNADTGLGIVLPNPGLVFTRHDSVEPDVVWLSRERYAAITGDDQHLHGPPELVVEVLSPGAKNEQRDRETKLALYSRQGVDEYWIVDVRARAVEVYRRAAVGAPLARVAVVGREHPLTSPLLPRCALRVADLFLL